MVLYKEKTYNIGAINEIVYARRGSKMIGTGAAGVLVFISIMIGVYIVFMLVLWMLSWRDTKNNKRGDSIR